MGSAQDGGAEAMLEGLAHQVAHHLARDSTAGRQPPHYFAVAAIETEQHLDRFSVPAANGEHIRAPAQIALKRDHHPIVAALASAVVARQQQLIDPHDPVGALMVDPRTSLRVELAIEQRGDPPISITGALRDDRANHGHQPFVIGSRAAQRSAFEEGVASLKQALELLHNVPEDRQLLRLELTIQSSLSRLWVNVRSVGSPEFRLTMERAVQLSEQLGDLGELFWSLLRLSLSRVFSEEFPKAHQLAQRSLDLAEESRRPGALSFAHMVLAQVLQRQ